MALNTRTEYALRALLEIPCKDEGSISANAICENQKLPKKYVEHLLNSLRNAGLIDSFAGSRGGYSLARPETEISLLDLMDAVDDHSQELACEMSGQYCMKDGCGLDVLFNEITRKQRDLVGSYTLDKIREKRCKESK